MGGWVGGWLYKHENITNSASNSVEVGAGAELGNMGLLCTQFMTLNYSFQGLCELER